MKNTLSAFIDDPQTAVFTTHSVVSKLEHVLRVFHDREDGAWQFLGIGDIDEKNAKVVSLAEIIELDPSLTEIVDLPLGWSAWRNGIGAKWKRAEYLF